MKKYSNVSTTGTAASAAAKKYKKGSIPTALRQQVWLKHCGETYKRKCLTTWCTNIITVYDFHCGHNIPEVRGGKTTANNLIPICKQCNLSMGCHYTFDEWCATFSGNDTVNGAPLVSTCCCWSWA